MRYTTKRNYSWSAAIAYTVGLIASDGCLQQDGRHIDLTSVDMQQLTNFRAAIGRQLPISHKVNNSNTPAFHIQFSDVAYYDFLMEVGLTPAKSKTIGRLAIPDTYYADFLRGMFDGDGSTHAYMDPRWRSSYMFYTLFASASITCMKYLQETNMRLIGVTKGSIRTSKRAYTLAYAKADSRRISKFMYYADNVIALDRKRDKLLGFIQRDKTGIIA